MCIYIYIYIYCVEHVLWECSEYSIRKEFIKNLDGFLQNDFHLKSSFDKTKYIFDQSIWECNGHFDHWLSNTKASLCGIWNLHREKIHITHEHLDRDISALEIKYVMKSLRNRKASGSDGIAGELIKYGGNGVIMMLKELFLLIWDSEYIPEQWREGMIVSLFKKGDREDPGNYRGITLLNVVGKLFNKVLNYRLLQWLEEHNKLSESQAGFRFDCSCVDNIFILNEVIQGRLQEGKKTFCYFLDNY